MAKSLPVTAGVRSPQCAAWLKGPSRFLAKRSLLLGRSASPSRTPSGWRVTQPAPFPNQGTRGVSQNGGGDHTAATRTYQRTRRVFNEVHLTT